jgi:hypothetical protein
MRTFLIIASILALALALPAKVKRDAPYPAAIPIPVPHETYGPPEVKLVEHDEDCVADGRWLDDVHDKKWDNTLETEIKPVETIVHHTLPETHHVVETTVVHTLPHHEEYKFPTFHEVKFEVPTLHSEYGPPPTPVEEVKFEVPTLHAEYGPPPPPVEEVKLFPYPAAVPLVKVEEEHDEDCVVDGRWISDLHKIY